LIDPWSRVGGAEEDDMTNLNATVATVLVMLAFLAGQSVAGRYYYDKVQDKVRKEVEKAMAKNPSVGPALVRLVFHDCWVYVSMDMHVASA
jgi:peroxidase